MTVEIRAKFEEWAEANWGPVLKDSRFKEAVYANAMMETVWQAFRAGYEARVIEENHVPDSV